jgi:hypothetical protein
MTYLGGGDPSPDDIDDNAKTYDVNSRQVAGIRLWWKRVTDWWRAR